MPKQIANVSLPTSTPVGTTGTVSWAKLLAPLPIQQQMMPQAGGGPTVAMYNESPCQLLITLPNSQGTFSLPSGRWAAITMPPDEQSFQYSVTSVVSTALFTNLLVDYYGPGESVHALGVLGNSPVGLGNVASITQVVQDGQANGNTIVEATPSGQPQNILITTDGVCRMVAYRILPGVSGSTASIDFETPYVVFRPPEAGATALGFDFQTWTGAAMPSPLSIGGAKGGLCNIDDSGNVVAPSFQLSPAVSASLAKIDYEAPFMVLRSAEAGATPQGFVLQCWDGAAGQNAFGVNAAGTAGTNVASSGAVDHVAGQALTGTMGVVGQVGRKASQLVTGTLSTTILSFTPTQSGMYEVHLAVSSAATTTGFMTGQVNYTDADSSGARASFFVHGNVSAGASGAILSNGGTTLTFPNDFPFTPVTVHAKASNAITVTYQNSSTTTSDKVTAIITRVD